MLHCQLLYQTRSSVGTNCCCSGTLFRQILYAKSVCLLLSFSTPIKVDLVTFFRFRCASSDVREQQSRVQLFSNGHNYFFLDIDPCYHTLDNATCILSGVWYGSWILGLAWFMSVAALHVSQDHTRISRNQGYASEITVRDQDQDQDQDQLRLRSIGGPNLKTIERVRMFETLVVGTTYVSLAGTIMWWLADCPLFCSEGFRCTLIVKDEIGYTLTLHITTVRIEDNVFVTRSGQEIIANNVLIEAPFAGSTSTAFLEEDRHVEIVRYVDLEAARFLGTRSHGFVVEIILEKRSGEDFRVQCTDKVKCSELFQLELGAIVRLFNVKIDRDLGMFLTDRSGIRVCEEPLVLPPPVPPPLPSPPPKPVQKQDWRTRWECILCGKLNFIGHVCCRRCNSTRKEGPATKDIARKRNYGEGKWVCYKCKYDKNRDFSTSCLRCDSDRPTKKGRN